ncbi:hypothetical protein K0M31_005794 [Melipona bicolor]|uniref:Protein Wnt n=1 Tax=Melipona bicolor TaxID=60889 RepID=A0AA40FU31_9HYME|nr:hypothetical protein K0M31_005794 [Melipona bicolor]
MLDTAICISPTTFVNSSFANHTQQILNVVRHGKSSFVHSLGRSKATEELSSILRENIGYLGIEPRLNSGSSPGSGGDGQAQIVGAGVIGPASAEKNCKSVHLTAKQQAICSRSPPVLQAVSAGARLAIEECQHQFRSARWNCSISSENPDNIFGGVMLVRGSDWWILGRNENSI